MKRVLIFTVTAGDGHNSAARAMKEKLQKAGCVVEVVDVFNSYASKFDTWIVDGGYNFAVGHLCKIYNFFYEIFRNENPSKALVCGAQHSVRDMHGKLLKKVYSFQPDCIYCTHFYPAIVLTNLKKIYKIPCKIVCCMLDYVRSPFWEATTGVDVLTMPNEQLRAEMVEYGFKNEQLVATGIPINEKFSEIKLSKEEARTQLGLKNMFSVLVFFGGGCWAGAYAAVKGLVKYIKNDIQIVVVNGHNEKSRKKIDNKRKKYPKNIVIKNLGYSKEIPLFMRACDVMIGKGGGLSITESMTCQIPLIATQDLTAQEKYNVKFFVDKNMAMSFKNGKDLAKKVGLLMENPDKLQEMTHNQKDFNGNGVNEIYKLIVNSNDADWIGVNVHLDYARVDKIIKRQRKKEYKELGHQN